MKTIEIIYVIAVVNGVNVTCQWFDTQTGERGVKQFHAKVVNQSWFVGVVDRFTKLDIEAITLGDTIRYQHGDKHVPMIFQDWDYNWPLIHHEVTHIAQRLLNYDGSNVKFLYAYFRLLWKYGYMKHPMELEADRIQIANQ